MFVFIVSLLLILFALAVIGLDDEKNIKKILSEKILIIIYFITALIIVCLSIYLNPLESTAKFLEKFSYYGTIATLLGLFFTICETTRSISNSRKIKESLINSINSYDHQHCVNILSQVIDSIHGNSFVSAYLHFKIFRRILAKNSAFKIIVSSLNDQAYPSDLMLPKNFNNAMRKPSEKRSQQGLVNNSDNQKVSDDLKSVSETKQDDIELPVMDKPIVNWGQEYYLASKNSDIMDKVEAQLGVLAHQNESISLRAEMKMVLVNEIMSIRSLVERNTVTYDSK